MSASVLVVRNGAVVHSAGALDLAQPVASVSKQFVAAAVGLLAARGELAFGDPVDRWFGPWGPTVHQLLTHTGGLGHWDAVGGWESFVTLGPDERVAAIRASRPVPGWSYSGLGYLLLAAIVERCAGVAYGQFVATELLAPAGMTATTSGGAGLRSLPGTGDLDSTPADLCRWPTAPLPYDRSVLIQPYVDVGTRAISTPVATAAAYGYGVFLGTLAGHPATFHAGDNPGHQSLLARIPGTDTTLAVLLPADDVPMSTVVEPLLPYLR